MKYFILGITIVALLGLVLILSGCIKNDNPKTLGTSTFAKDEQELDKSLGELNANEITGSDELSEDLDALDDSSLSNDETQLDSDMSEIENLNDDDITADLESLEDLN